MVNVIIEAVVHIFLLIYYNGIVNKEWCASW